MSGPELLTRRLRLRPCASGDLDSLHAHFVDPGVRRYLWDDLVIPAERAEGVIDASQKSFAAHGYGIWCVFERDAAPLAGVCGLAPIEDTPEIELLYGIAPALWGAGLAVEASRAVLAHGFEGVGLTRIAARVDSPNRASIRVLEKLGMDFEHESPVNGRPTVHYGQTREAFRTLRDEGAAP